MEDLKRMAAIKTADVQQAAAMSLGGGVDASSSGAADSSSSGGRSTDSLESSTTSMVGTLLNNGGIRDCKVSGLDCTQVMFTVGSAVVVLAGNHRLYKEVVPPLVDCLQLYALSRNEGALLW
jgi:hypothetical protein